MQGSTDQNYCPLNVSPSPSSAAFYAWGDNHEKNQTAIGPSGEVGPASSGALHTNRAGNQRVFVSGKLDTWKLEKVEDIDWIIRRIGPGETFRRDET